MNEIRCTKCGKLLLKAAKEHEAGTPLSQCDIEIQCTRCKAINCYKVK